MWYDHLSIFSEYHKTNATIDTNVVVKFLEQVDGHLNSTNDTVKDVLPQKYDKFCFVNAVDTELKCVIQNYIDVRQFCGTKEPLGEELDYSIDISCDTRITVHDIQGKTRRSIFPSKAHFLAYLIIIAPTKIIDGMWLSSSRLSIQDYYLRDLISLVYYEEMGEGVIDNNHMEIYRKLLASFGFHGVNTNSDLILTDTCYIESALQLCLGACDPNAFIPEILGYTLGYESLGLGILIMRDECRFWGVSDTYFSQHISIDNHHCGHAKVMQDAVMHYMEGIMARGEDVECTWERVKRGYHWNVLTVAPCDTRFIDDILRRHIEIRIAEKCLYGEQVHFKTCVKGIVLRDALGACADNPNNVWKLLELMKDKGWVTTEAGLDSWFFQTCDAKMPHVYTPYDRELLIEGIRMISKD